MTDETTLESMQRVAGYSSAISNYSTTVLRMERAIVHEAPEPVKVEPIQPPQVDSTLGAKFDSNGYGDWKYQHAKIAAQAQCLAKYLPAFMAEHNADFIAVRGTSGTFIAGALQVLIEVPVLLMRKEGEKSHGNKLEGYDDHVYKRGIILDDFVCTGGTVRGMMADAAAYPIEFVAILEHYNADASSRAPSLKPMGDSGERSVLGLNVYRFYS